MKKIYELLLPTSVLCFSFWLWYYKGHWVDQSDFEIMVTSYMHWIFFFIAIASGIGIIYYTKKGEKNK